MSAAEGNLWEPVRKEILDYVYTPLNYLFHVPFGATRAYAPFHSSGAFLQPIPRALLIVTVVPSAWDEAVY